MKLSIILLTYSESELICEVKLSMVCEDPVWKQENIYLRPAGR